MAETTLFELVSPDSLIMSKEVTMVVVPGAEGLFGVLPRHSPLLSTLIPGVIDVYEGSSITDRIFIPNGFAEVTGERCTVLTEKATPADELDLEGLDKEIEAKLNELKESSGEDEDRLKRVIAEQKVVLTAMRNANI